MHFNCLWFKQPLISLAFFFFHQNLRVHFSYQDTDMLMSCLSLKGQTLKARAAEEQISTPKSKQAVHTWATCSPGYITCNIPLKNLLYTSYSLCFSYIHINWLTVVHFHYLSRYHIANEIIFQETLFKIQIIVPTWRTHKNWSKGA